MEPTKNQYLCGFNREIWGLFLVCLSSYYNLSKQTISLDADIEKGYAI